MSKHPQARLRSPDYWSSKVDPYHFDENPTRALTLVEALQDAKTYYNIPAEIGKAGAWLPERYKTAASHERVRSSISLAIIGRRILLTDQSPSRLLLDWRKLMLSSRDGTI